MDLMIERAVVAAVLSNIDHALKAAIESGVEDPALRFGATFDCDLAQGFVPPRLSRILDSFKAPRRNFAPQVFLRLLNADKGNAVAKVQRFRVGGGDHPPSSIVGFRLEGHRRAKFAVDISLHSAKAFFASDYVAVLRLQITRQPVGKHNRSPAVRKAKAKVAAPFGR